MKINKLITRDHVLVAFLLVAMAISALFMQNWQKIFVSAQHAYYILKNPQNHNFKSRIDVFKFTSPSLNGASREARVYLPPEYDVASERHFPVLYLLHGAPGNDLDWLINANLQSTLDNLISNGEIQPMIVVFPDGNGPTVSDGQYINATIIDQKMADYIVKDVVVTIDDKYRTIPNSDKRGIGGPSSGGYAAVNLSLRNPDVFSVALSHSGYFLNREHVLKNLISSDPKELNAISPQLYLPDLEIGNKPSIYLDYAESDYKEFINQNIDFDKALTQASIEHKLVVNHGHHGWENWRISIVESLKYFNSKL